jgi:hypothetical protein
MVGKPPEFRGFEGPPFDVNAPTWFERSLALYDNHKGQWAKYGPYKSAKTLSNTKVRLNGAIQKQMPQDCYIDVVIKGDYLYVRVI